MNESMVQMEDTDGNAFSGWLALDVETTADLREWMETGLTPEEAAAWNCAQPEHKAGSHFGRFTVAAMREWSELGFNPAEAKEWRLIARADIAVIWRGFGWTPQEATELVLVLGELGRDRHLALVWAATGWPVAFVQACARQDLGPHEVHVSGRTGSRTSADTQKMALNNLDRQTLKEFIDACSGVGIKDLQALSEWFTTDLSPNEILDWAGTPVTDEWNEVHEGFSVAGWRAWSSAGFSAEEAREWAGCGPEAAVLWRRGGGEPAQAEVVLRYLDPQRSSDIVDWAASGLPTDYMIACIEAGLRPAEAGRTAWEVSDEVLQTLTALRQQAWVEESVPVALQPWRCCAGAPACHCPPA